MAAASASAPEILVVSRYAPDEQDGSLLPLSDADRFNDSLDEFNSPRFRRALILTELAQAEGCKVVFQTPPQPLESLKIYKCAHKTELLEFLSTAWQKWDALGPEGQDPASSLHSQQPDDGDVPQPKTLPLIPGNVTIHRDPHQRPSSSVMGQIGYYCTDTCTPVFANLLEELKWDAATVVDAVNGMLPEGDPPKVVYALATHPGHHAAADSFGGYCYINHAAFAARMLQRAPHHKKRVAVLDIDYHCGNGTASIFYEDPTVLMISIHCSPDHDYPFHSGFEDQNGHGEGKGTTLHLPLMPGATWEDAYRPALERAMDAITDFGSEALVVSMGLDTLKGDPCAVRRAGFCLSGSDYLAMGELIGQKIGKGIPTLFIQEGGYKTDDVPKAATDVLVGFVSQR